MLWNDYFMNLVYLVAMRSKDENTHVGAVIVRPDNTIVSTGYNSFPMGIKDNIPERQTRPYKYFFMAHAEFNSIILSKTDLRGCIMYTNGIPCSNCGRAIIQAGITKVYYDEEWSNYSNKSKWDEEAEATKDMFFEAGIELIPLKVNLIKIYKQINENRIE